MVLVLDTRYLLEPGIYANPGKLQELVLYISVLFVLRSTDLLPKPSQIMQNKTVDHGLTHQAAQCNWSVFVQDMPGKTPAIHLVWELSSTQKSAFIWASGPGEKGQGADCSLLFFWRQFTCFPKHEECCWELRPRNRSLGSIHLSGKQGVMGKVFHGIFPVGKKDEGNGQRFPKA